MRAAKTALLVLTAVIVVPLLIVLAIQWVSERDPYDIMTWLAAWGLGIAVWALVLGGLALYLLLRRPPRA